MPLKLSLTKGEKIIVNGVVIRNDGDHADLVFENHAQILRQKDTLTPDTASTPASRVYFALQCGYLFPDKATHSLDTFRGLLADYIDAAPSAKGIADEILEKVEVGHLYQALRLCTQLIDHESEVLSHVV